MSSLKENLAPLRNKKTKEVYYSRKNKKLKNKLKLKKYSRVLRQHIVFDEAKK